MAWDLAGWRITRVEDPGSGFNLPSDAEVLRRSPWLHPDYVTDDWELRIGSSAILIEGPEMTAIVDPWLAFDDPAKFAPRLAALAAAGVDPAAVDVVVNTHVDGIGANVIPGTADPAFPNARYLLPAAELPEIEGGRRLGAEALLQLVEPVAGELAIAPGLVIQPLPGHNAGHVGVVVGTPPGAVVIGHLFLHPAQIANPDVVQGDFDPDVLRLTRRRTLERCVDEDLVLVGPLFAAPGGGHIRRDGDGWVLEPA